MLSIRPHIISILCLYFVATTGIAQIYNSQIEAKINLESNTEYINVTGSAFNKTEINQSVRYVLSVIKNNPTTLNRSKNDQSGRVVLNAGQKKNLSTTTINANETDRIILLLLIYDLNDKLLGKDRIVINGTEEDKAEAKKKLLLENTLSEDVAHEKDDGVVMRGIVIEETKTKPGRDFYKMFYSLYQGNNINGEKIVTIKEALAIANNTKIEVLVDGELVMEFFVRPQNDYLQGMSEMAIKKVYIRLRDLKNGSNIIKHY